jgi:glycosyltransferase involved in cell wall biosynthesis
MITKKTLISIIIPAYNEESSIAESIRSLQQQETSFPYEIVVVDNASTDNTATIATSLGVKVIHEPNKGIYYARQAGLMQVQSKYTVFIDADSHFEKRWIEKAIGYLEKHPDYVAVSSNFYFYDGDFLLKSILFLTLFLPTQIVLPFLRLFHRPEFIFGNAYAARTDTLIAVGASSKDFPFYGDDMALANRLGKKGKIRFLQATFVGTSARRFQYQGILKTLHRYGFVNTYLILGLEKKASSFSKRYN